jgi:hypothetical protein
MANQKVIERALILWLLSYGVFFSWSAYVVASPERLGSANCQVSGFENLSPKPTTRNEISRSQ